MGFLSKLFASTASPTWSLADLAAFAWGRGGRESDSGVLVNHHTAMGYGPWYRGVTLLSADTAKIPLTVYKRSGKGKVPDTAHDAYRLLRGDPNGHDTPFHFIELLTAWAITRGNGYAFIERDDGVTPSALLPMPPEWITPERKNGMVWYVLRVPGSDKPKAIPAEDVLHIRGYGHDSLAGIDVVSFAAESLGLAIGQRRYSSIFFRNSGRPAVTLESPVIMKPEAKLQAVQGWDRMYSGLDNAHRTALLDGGMKANVLSFNAEESQLIESRQLSVREAALFLCIPAHKISDIARTSFSSLEQENSDYLTSSLDPWLCRWEGECRKKLLTEEEKRNDSHVVEFERNRILQADLASRTAYYTAALGGHPWMAVNEVRGDIGLNPDPDGDEIAKPLNMASPGGDPDKPHKKAPGKPQGDADDEGEASARLGLREALEAATARLVRRVGAAAVKASSSVSKYMAWLDKVQDENADVAASAFAGLARMAGTPDAADALLGRLHIEYAALADAATPSTLAGAVESLSGRLASELPASYASNLLGEKP